MRKKVADLQKQRNSLLSSVADQRAKARNELLKNLNPIISDYMKEKNKNGSRQKSLLLTDGVLISQRIY